MKFIASVDSCHCHPCVSRFRFQEFTISTGLAFRIAKHIMLANYQRFLSASLEGNGGLKEDLIQHPEDEAIHDH